MRTLLVEDDFTAGRLLQKVLVRHGECHTAVNSKEAVEAFQNTSESGGPGYDLICMDILMPEMNGHDAIKQIRVVEPGRGVLSTAGTNIIMAAPVEDMKEVIRSFRGWQPFLQGY
jgi:two-component system chemotaxis response regulator CheY